MRSMSAAEAILGPVFTFPGQGSYSYPVLRELYTSYPQTVPHFHKANEIGRELLKGDFLSLVTAGSTREHDDRLNACPDLNQIGIYLTEVLIAGILIESGVKPSLLVGHSFGELAALAVGGAYSIETGLKIVCHRVLALQSNARPGTLAAVSGDFERAKLFIEESGNNSIEVSVINHSRQTVLAGTVSELEELSAVLNRQGVSLSFLKSSYPFHSSSLQRAVEPFHSALRTFDFRPANIPVYLCMEGMLYSPGFDLAQGISSQFVRPLNFMNVVKTLYNSGYRTFIESGAGDTVSKLIAQNLQDSTANITTQPVTTLEGGVREGLLKVIGLGLASNESVLNKTQLSESLFAVVKDMSQLVQSTSRLIEQVSGSLTASETIDTAHLEEKPDLPLKENGLSVYTKQAEVAAPSSNGGNGFKPRSAVSSEPQQVFPVEECTETPVAIVSLGCVLPGAHDPEEYWSNILNGVSGISNLADVDPSTAQDFLAGTDGGQIKIIPDKTYTLLFGNVVGLQYNAALLLPAYTREQFEALTRGQKLLVVALAQSLSRLKTPINRSVSHKIQCIVGATADGSKEYDDALFLESVEKLVATLDEPEDLRRAFADTYKQITGYQSGDSKKLTQHKIYSDVVEKVLGGKIPTYVVDTACSSSLYSTYLGIKALQDGDSDIVLAGGVFAPGPANNTLFAQFRGLTHRESRPFDADADGVVFGEGAGIVILKRLPDALNDGDNILGVIRGIGLSSDGKSPSINVPQSKGQALAIRSAYQQSGIDPNTIQYVEAHATATLVGDAVEFSALKDAINRNSDAPRIELGSVKALVGHTGWAAGVASLIKICKAFESRIIPRQYHYVTPSVEIDVANSQFTISQTSHPWGDNIAHYPRRAAINGFGFGGTNAHLILEDFDDGYHRNLCRNLKLAKKAETELAVISIGSLFPGVDQPMTAGPSTEHRFRRESLRLPAKKMLLPDVTEHMDASQYLAPLAAEAVFANLPEGWTRLKNAMGVVLGLEAKTERGMRANERVFVDRLRRQVSEFNGNGKLSNADRNRILDKLVEKIRARNIASGPYTLPGLMPNVTASRITNMFDLNGPNIVVDMGDDSLLQSIFVAHRLLAHDACKIVLAGGINADGADNAGNAEGVVLLALATTETARREGLPVLCTIRLSESNKQSQVATEVSEINPALNYRAAQGAPEMLRAIEQARAKSLSSLFKRPASSPIAHRTLVFGPASAPEKSLPAQTDTSTYSYVKDTPIRYYTPRLVPAKIEGEPAILKGRRILFLIDRPDQWLALERSGALDALEYNVVCSRQSGLANSLTVDLTSDDSIRRSVSDLANLEFDVVIAVKDLQEHSKETLLLNNLPGELEWIDLLFAVCRENFDRLQNQKIPVIVVCQSAYSDADLDPYTGLVSGFMKSLSRELDGPLCRVINTDEINLHRTLRQVEIELGHPGSEVEVCYKDSQRSAVALVPVENLAVNNHPYIDSNSVVICTGGARGVTAVLVEELLTTFGCRVIALGRSDPSLIPEEIRNMDEQSFKDYEPQFYKNELARNKGRKIGELKREYLACRAANEVHQVTKRLQAISGKYEYQSVDITSEKAIDEVVEAVYRQHGRVDLVLHGAGIQISKAITKKSISDFRGIITTKLGGLSNLYRACKKYGNGGVTHFHILTSVFSYMGNDGQPDYGAANQAMDRIADCMNSSGNGTHWSSMAWLGWAGIGMTRDSEFAALAASRRLRGVTKEEGQHIFRSLMKGAPTEPINILLADGEIDYYKVAIDTSQTSQPVRSQAKHKQDFHTIQREMSVESAPYLVNHLVDGVPTMPGAMIIAVVGEAARELRPDLKIISFEKALFRRFIKVYKNRKTVIRIDVRIVSEDDRQTLVKARILSDFVHSTGAILQKDILQFEVLVRMSPTTALAPKCFDRNNVLGRLLPDPYLMSGSPVRLSGPFESMQNIIVGDATRTADFKLVNSNHSSREYQSMLTRVVLMDSLWRFGVIQLGADNSLPVFVPEECEIMKVFFDFDSLDISKLVGPLTFTGANPRLDGDRLSIGPVSAIDSDGNTLLLVEHGICLKFGEAVNGVLLARA